MGKNKGEIIKLDKDIVYEACERETHITITDDDNKWKVYTRQKPVITKLMKIGKMVKGYEFDGKIKEAEFELDKKQISFRKLRELTDEERQAKSENMKKIQEQRRIDNAK